MGTLSISLIFAGLTGYLLGSIPFGLLLTRYAGLGDVRSIGSGNIGATNVLRTGNKKLAAATLLCDMLKGTAAVMLGSFIAAKIALGAPVAIFYAGLAAGLGAFLGHLYPVWLKFKGGKGVATYIGVLLGLSLTLAAVFCVVWLLVAFASRYSSLAALIASLATPAAALYTYGAGALVAVLALMTLLLFWKHKDNISRLSAGKESKIGQK